MLHVHVNVWSWIILSSLLVSGKLERFPLVPFFRMVILRILFVQIVWALSGPRWISVFHHRIQIHQIILSDF